MDGFHDQDCRMSQHTPTPWEVWGDGQIRWTGYRDRLGRKSLAVVATVHIPRQRELESMGGKYGQAIEIRNANAEFIVRACNNHDDLLAACQMLVGWCDGLEGRPGEDGFEALEACVSRARAAISKAEGGAA